MLTKDKIEKRMTNVEKALKKGVRFKVHGKSSI
jgi:hypothetical protein